MLPTITPSNFVNILMYLPHSDPDANTSENIQTKDLITSAIERNLRVGHFDPAVDGGLYLTQVRLTDSTSAFVAVKDEAGNLILRTIVRRSGETCQLGEICRPFVDINTPENVVFADPSIWPATSQLNPIFVDADVLEKLNKVL
jgi:hypothetical protein